MADVLCYIETLPDGTPKKSAAEVATAARSLAGDGAAVALVPNGGDAAASVLGAHGVDRMLTVSGDAFGRYLLDPHAAALRAGVEAISPAVVVLSASVIGKELGATVAAQTDRGLVSDATTVSLTGTTTTATKPKYAGKAFATLTVQGPAVVSIRPNAIAPEEASA